MESFVRHQLRVRNSDEDGGARAFYRALLDVDVGPAIVPLPVEAAARGAPAHWLTHVAAPDVERAAAELVAHGATRLGPTREVGDGARVAILRDPGGAVVALASPAVAGGPAVAWHVLHTLDRARTIAGYGAALGWRCDPVGEGPMGSTIARAPDGAPVAAIVDITGRAGVHPHWLAAFPVAAMAPAVATVRARAGLVVAEVTLGDGRLLAVCDDPLGAAFGLIAAR